MTLQVFQAVTLNTSAYQPRALLMQILSAEGPYTARILPAEGPQQKSQAAWAGANTYCSARGVQCNC